MDIEVKYEENQDDGNEKKQNPDENDDEEDFCDAADEDAEAGSLGIIANKINKFDNHNIDQEFRSVNERDALKKIIQEINEIKYKKKHNYALQQMKYSKQKISPSPGRLNIMIKESIENPFDPKAMDSHHIHVTKEEDEGNVFDTVDFCPEWQDNDENSLMTIEQDKLKQRNIKQRNNIFISGNEGGSSALSIIQNDRNPSSRKSI